MVAQTICFARVERKGKIVFVIHVYYRVIFLGKNVAERPRRQEHAETRQHDRPVEIAIVGVIATFEFAQPLRRGDDHNSILRGATFISCLSRSGKACFFRG